MNLKGWVIGEASKVDLGYGYGTALTLIDEHGLRVRSLILYMGDIVKEERTRTDDLRCYHVIEKLGWDILDFANSRDSAVSISPVDYPEERVVGFICKETGDRWLISLDEFMGDLVPPKWLATPGKRRLFAVSMSHA